MGRRLFVAYAFALCLSGSVLAADTSGVGGAPPPPVLTADDYAAVRAYPDDEALFQAFLDKLPSVTVKQNGADHRYYIYEGDLLLARDEVRYELVNGAGARTGSSGKGNPSRELIVAVQNGRPSIWPKGQRALTYDVDEASFPDPATYQQVVAGMEQASREWVAACPQCGVSLTHLAAHDAAPHDGDATFIVSYSPVESGTVAVSFFPYDPPEKRRLYVFPDYLDTSYDHVGVFRHEIGHILGYRHEHIRPQAGCQNEAGAWQPLSPYDRRSVMHYFCGKGGTLTLALTGIDKASHRKEYAGGAV